MIFTILRISALTNPVYVNPVYVNHALMIIFAFQIYSFVEDVAASGGYWLACAGQKIFVSSRQVILCFKPFFLTLIDFLPIVKRVPQFLIKGKFFLGEGETERGIHRQSSVKNTY